MEIIRKANILDQKDLLLLENHNLDEKYGIERIGIYNKNTRLMLLINFLNKYPHNIINNIIKEYITLVPNEINKVNGGGFTALKICSVNHFVNTAEILLKNGFDVNTKDERYATEAYIAQCVDLNITKLLIEYDANIDFKKKYTEVKILKDIAILNTKN